MYRVNASGSDDASEKYIKPYNKLPGWGRNDFVVTTLLMV